jgi:hypothetical protein
MVALPGLVRQLRWLISRPLHGLVSNLPRVLRTLPGSKYHDRPNAKIHQRLMLLMDF